MGKPRKASAAQILRKWLRKRWKFWLAFVLLVSAVIAVSVWLFDFTTVQNIVLLLVAAVVGTVGFLADVKSLLDDETPKTSKTDIHAGQVQVVSGEDATGFQVNYGDHYEGGVHNHPPAPEKPKPQVTPSPNPGSPDYISRGEIEYTLRKALQNHTTMAVVGATGLGGVGKSELAKQLARELEQQRKSSTLWVDLPGKSLETVHSEMAVALAVPLPPNANKEQRAQILRSAMQEQERTVFLDDVRPEFLPDLRYCLPPSPPCSALITSRIHDLGLAPGAVRELDVMDLLQARSLLRCHEGLPALLDAEPGMEDRLIEACCFHPLALSLAAQRLLEKRYFWTKPVDGLVQALEHRLDELKRNGLTGKDASLRANMDESYRSLNEDEQRCFRALSVFAPTGFGLDVAAAVWQVERTAAGAMVERLVNFSLLRSVENRPGRWRLHELLRDYAAEKLAGCGEQPQAETALAEWLIQLFEEHYTDDRSSAPYVALEQDNLTAAARRALESGQGRRLALLATAPRNWLMVWGLWSDWEGWLRGALAAGAGEDYLTARVHETLGDVQRRQNQYDAALESYDAALGLYRAVGDRRGEANTLKGTGNVQAALRQYDAALESYAAALALYRVVSDRLGEANTLAGQGQVLLARGDQAGADRLLAQAVELYRAIGDRYSIATQTGNYGGTLYNLGRKAAARPYLLRAAELFEEYGFPEQAARHRRFAAEN